jgi:hypothetical protein
MALLKDLLTLDFYETLFNIAGLALQLWNPHWTSYF